MARKLTTRCRSPAWIRTKITPSEGITVLETGVLPLNDRAKYRCTGLALPLRYTPILKKGATINMTPFNGGRNPPHNNAPNSVGAHPLRWRFLTNSFLNANHMYHSPY